MGQHSDSCKPSCNDSHNYQDHSSKDYWGGPPESSSSKDKGCFIATSVYGNSLAPEVIELRQFRDDVLKKTWWGRAFIAIYYTVSPPIAEGLKKTPRIAAVVRLMLDRVVKRIK